MKLAPIALFVYNRPDHTRRTVDSLQKNDLAGQSPLIIFSDGPRNPESAQSVNEVRRYIQHIDGFKSVTIVERGRNFGLARSIIDGVSSTLGKSERIIVMEDDMVTSPHFLAYMNSALDQFADDERIVSIHGYVYPVSLPLPEAFFLRGADCWGWATWKRGWECFNENGQALLDELKRRKLMRAFDFNGAYPYTKMLEGQIEGRNDSWAVRWHASAFLAEKLTLYPGRSLVQNIGNDDSGTHCGDSTAMQVELSPTPIDLNAIEVKPSQEGREAFEAFFRQREDGLLRRLVRRVASLIAIAS